MKSRSEQRAGKVERPKQEPKQETELTFKYGYMSMGAIVLALLCFVTSMVIIVAAPELKAQGWNWWFQLFGWSLFIVGMVLQRKQRRLQERVLAEVQTNINESFQRMTEGLQRVNDKAGLIRDFAQAKADGDNVRADQIRKMMEGELDEIH